MPDDRRAHDPFAPAPSPAEDTPAIPDVDPPVSDDLDDMTKSELIDLAEQRGVPSWGTKADLIDRIRFSSER